MMTNVKNWNKRVDHPLQSYEWGEFRKTTGVEVIREEGIQITIHKIPHLPFTVGYYPKGTKLGKKEIATIARIAEKSRCIYIKCEPKIEEGEQEIIKKKLVPGRALFTKYNFVLDVRPSEKTLLSRMKQKTRYNIRLAEKRGVKVEIDNSPEALARYLELTEETTKRQGFYAHSPTYHQKMWEVMHQAGMADLLVARYQGKIITTWVVFSFGDTLYYPYGASSREQREVMANNLVMWEAIKLAKKRRLKYLDMWGALGPEPDSNDPWYGFHKFKEGYGGRLVEYVGTWDYVARPLLYCLYRGAEWARWLILRLAK